MRGRASYVVAVLSSSSGASCVEANGEQKPHARIRIVFVGKNVCCCACRRYEIARAFVVLAKTAHSLV